jgi:hypothetical protein
MFHFSIAFCKFLMDSVTRLSMVDKSFIICVCTARILVRDPEFSTTPAAFGV